MHAVEVLQKCLSAAFAPMHVYRRRALLGAVQALLSCRRLILMDLARAWPGAERVRAPLKRLDRLLSNVHLGQEREALYAEMLRWLIRQPQPLLLIDWSDLHEDCRWQLLRASIPLDGRSLTVLEMVFPQSMKGSPRAEKRFLQRLKTMLPEGVRPIVVTDAGFRAPWLRLVHGFGWCYVGRLRGRTRIQVAAGEWFDNRQLHGQIDGQARRLEAVCIVQKHPWLTDLVLYRKPARGRRRLTCRGTRSRAHTSLKAEKREREPWVLVVSAQLRALSARQIVAIYRKRMQIEESFRDLKCDRFGCAFRYSLTRRPQRIAILLLIHALATFVAWLAAITLTARAFVRYGAVSAQVARAHYSRLRIAWEALRHGDPHCHARQLHQVFRRPPAQFLQLLQIPL